MKSIHFFTILLLSIFFIQCNKNSNEKSTQSDVRFPGEFEPQESVWMGWPWFDYKKDWSIKETHAQIWAALAPTVFLDIAVNPDDSIKGITYDGQIAEIKSLMKKYNVPVNKVRFHKIVHEDVWWRDMGPIYVVNKENKLEIADFRFNGWGYENKDNEYSSAEEKVDENVAKYSKLNIRSTELISEGGNKEFNGKGTLIIVESVEKNRNPDKTKSEIEEEYKKILGVTNIIWLPYGRYDDDLTFKGKLPNKNGQKEYYTVITTGGHVDEHTRFANENTILYTEVSEEDAKNSFVVRENKRRMEANLKVLKNAKDQDGNPFKLIPMPSAPEVVVELKPGDGTYDYLAINDSMKVHNPIPKDKPIKVLLAASYLNFLISNKVVVAQKYWAPGKPEEWKKNDEKALSILQKTFPDRKIVSIDAKAINIGGGGIHCNTQQKPLLIKK